MRPWVFTVGIKLISFSSKHIIIRYLWNLSNHCCSTSRFPCEPGFCVVPPGPRGNRVLCSTSRTLHLTQSHWGSWPVDVSFDHRLLPMLWSQTLTHTHTHTLTHTHAHSHTHTLTHSLTHSHAHTHTLTHTHMPSTHSHYAYVYVNIHSHTHTCIYTHTCKTLHAGTYVSMFTHICMFTYVCMFTYNRRTQTHTCNDTHAHVSKISTVHRNVLWSADPALMKHSNLWLLNAAPKSSLASITLSLPLHPTMLSFLGRPAASPPRPFTPSHHQTIQTFLDHYIHVLITQDIECKYGFLECKYRSILHGSSRAHTGRAVPRLHFYSSLYFVSSCGLDKICQTCKNSLCTCVITYIYLSIFSI